MRSGNPGGKFNPTIIPGAVFNKLTVVERLPKDKSGRYKILCKCDCGGVCTPTVDSLVRGNTKSCGCLRKEAMKRAREAPREYKYKEGVLPGEIYGRLTVIKEIYIDEKPTYTVKCKCSCGATSVIVRRHELIRGTTKSCGCLLKEVTIKRNKETAKYKGFSGKHIRTYRAWEGMITRCYNKNCTLYKDYGAVGIAVCKYLKESPQNLVSLIGHRTKKKSSLDRHPIHNGNYSCGKCEECKRKGWGLNVRWATRREQSENRGSFNVWLEAFGKRMILSQWERESGLDARLIAARIKRGWATEKALTTPDPHGNCYHPVSI